MRLRSAVYMIGVAAVACSKDAGVTTPQPPTVSQLQVVSGAGQAAKPGAVLAESLVVRAVTSTGKPLSGVAITWTATAGSGTLSPTQSTTDSGGRAATRWTLGQGGTDSASAQTGSIAARFGARAVTSSSPVTWTVETSGTTHNLNAVWGSSGTNVYAAGDSGTFLHYDGTAWSQVQDSIIAAAFTSPTWTIWGSSATDVWAGFNNLIHFDGQHWARPSPAQPGNVPAFGIWGDSPTDVWISVNMGGENVLQYNGSQWLYQVIPPFMPGSHPVYCPTSWFIAGLSPNYIFNYDFCGAFYSFDGTTWRVYTTPGNPPYGTYPATMSAMWAIPGNAIYAIGGTAAYSQQRGVYVASSPTSWTLVPGSPTLQQTSVASGNSIGTMNGLWGDAANDLFAAVADTVYHYDGTNWTRQGNSSWNGWAIYGPSLTDIFVVGPHGFILHGRR